MSPLLVPVHPARHLLRAKDLADAQYARPLTVADLAAARGGLRSEGAAVIERSWGGTDVVDPEGNVVGLIAG